MESISEFCPAKLNLFLAITGRRADGFHELLSVAAPLAFGDDLTLSAGENGAGFTLSCNDETVPVGEENLIIRAARAFAERTGWADAVHFELKKRIPMGAGLGGGSSNATAALRGLNRLAGDPLSFEELHAVAAGIGSDCPLFLHDGPVVMRGRGEQIDPLPAVTAQRLVGKRVLVFKPWFSINTAWSYRTLAAEAPASYLPPESAESRLQHWIDTPEASLSSLAFNSLEDPAFTKFVALPAMLQGLREEFGLIARMSGSGSACFAFLDGEQDVAQISAYIRGAWGENALIVVSSLLTRC